MSMSPFAPDFPDLEFETFPIVHVPFLTGWAVGGRAARCEVLARLLKLNHERYAEEVAQGLHDKGKGKAVKTPRKSKGKASSEPSLFGEED
jgi:hypothetical protein